MWQGNSLPPTCLGGGNRVITQCSTNPRRPQARLLTTVTRGHGPNHAHCNWMDFRMLGMASGPRNNCAPPHGAAGPSTGDMQIPSPVLQVGGVSYAAVPSVGGYWEVLRDDMNLLYK